MERAKPTLTVSEVVYQRLLLLYPSQYIEKHGAEMLQNFQDLQRDSSSALLLWAFISKDLFISLTYQHMYNKTSKAMAFALVTYLPFLFLFVVATVFGATQFSVSFMAQLEAHVRIGFALIVILPGSGFLYLLATLIANLRREKTWNVFKLTFIRDNVLALAVLGVGFLILIFLPTHDMVPCYLTRVFQQGVQNSQPIIQYCLATY